MADTSCRSGSAERSITVGVTGGGDARVNVAVTDLAVVTLPSVHVEAVPSTAQSPPHPPKAEPLVALAVRATVVPLVKFALQVAGQVIPGGLLVTVPIPLPRTETVTETVPGGIIVRITGTVCGVFVAPGAVIVMVAEYVLATRPAMFTLTVIGSVSVAVVPDAGFKLSQGASPLRLQLSVPPPVFVMFRVCDAGLALPWTAVKLRLGGFLPMVGAAGVTVSVTPTAWGLAVAPGAVTVMVPV
jgi:hypothetical protein